MKQPRFTKTQIVKISGYNIRHSSTYWSISIRILK